jgi:hypothetical protein
MTKFLNNADVTGYISQTSVTSSLLKTDANGKLVAAVAGTDYATPGALASADKMVTIGRNSTGATLYKGTVVYISGSTGNRPNFVKAQANGESTSAGTFGVVLADIPNNSEGNVVTIGAIDNLDTRSTATNPFTSDTLADGDTIYLSPSTAGYITNVKPSAPNHIVYVGKVVRTSPTNGTIVYRIQNGYELDEIHDVAISSKANNDFIVYESATSLWKNKSIATVLGYTPANGANYLPLAGGTLTGGLYINPANTGVIGLDVASNTIRLRTDSGQPFPRQLTTTLGSGTLVKIQAAGYGATYVTDLGFYTSSGSAVNTTPNLYLTGGDNRVGINTTTPAYTLDVSGTIGASGAVTANSFVKASGTSLQFLMADGSVSLGATATARIEQIFTATSGQTTFTVTGGYVVGLVDVYINGVKLLPSDFTATNGSTVVLATGAVLNDSVTIINYTATIAALPTSRDVFDYTATAAQTTFTVSGGYTAGLLDVYVNGVKLTPSEVTATNGTTFVLSVASVTGDQVQAIRYNASVNGVSGSGTANYIPKFTASQTLGNSLIQDDGTNVIIGSTDSNLLMPRAAVTNNATVNFATGGTTKWNVGLRGIYSSDDFYIFNPVLGINYITLSASSSLANFGVSIRAQTFTSYIASGIFLNNSSAGTSSVHMRLNNTGGDLRMGIESSAGGGFQTGTSAYAAVFGNQANYSTQFTTNGTVRMTIAAGGDVSLTGALSGTSATFSGNVIGNSYRSNGRIFSTSDANYGDMTSTNGAVIMSFDSTGQEAYITSYNYTTSLSKPINIAGSKIILSGGNVGIGTTAPDTLLHIYGAAGWIKAETSSTGSARFQAKNATQTTDYGTDSSGGFIQTNGAYPLIIYTNQTERMRITSGGQVGIGVTSVNGYAKFEVNGNIMSSGSSTILMLNNTGGTAQSWWIGQDISGANDGIFYIYNQTSNSQAINIRKNNNVLLGTTTDIGARLHSNGNIISSGAGGSNGLLSRENSTSSTYGFFNAGNSSLVLTNSGVANVGYFAMSSGNYVATSDRNKKKDFEPSTLGLAEVLQLIPTMYRFKTEADDASKHLGFIAQDVKDVVPPAYKEELIGTDTFIGLESTAFIPVLVKAIQELKAELDLLKNK